MLRYLSYGPRNFNESPVPPNRRMNWEFYAILQGSGAPFLPEGHSPALRKSTLWILPAQSLHGWRGDKKSCLRAVFHFSDVPSELKQLIKDDGFWAVPLHEEQIKKVKGLAQELEQQMVSPYQFTHLACERALLDLVLIAVSNIKRNPRIPLDRVDEERLERALAWFNVHMHKNPTVEQVAASIHISSGHLRRIFKKCSNRSPHASFHLLKIKRASNLLATTSETIDLIASQCGFQSQSDFSRAFKKEMKITPNQWRTKIYTLN